MGAKKKYTDEEREIKKKENWYKNQRPKEIEEHKRLAPLRFESGRLSKKERKQFIDDIKQINKERLNSIFNDIDKWNRINSSSEEYYIKKERQERRKRNGLGKWINEKEVERAEQVIWGGRDIKIWEEEDEQNIEFKNPYKQNEENE